jgi:hypothetical protein
MDLCVYRRQRLRDRSPGNIGHVPKFHALDPVRKPVHEQGTMLGAIEGNDALSPDEIGLAHLPGIAYRWLKDDATRLESGEGVRGDRPTIIHSQF